MKIDEFLLARIAEDEGFARPASPGPWKPNAEHDEVMAVDNITVADGFALSSRQLRATVDHIARHNPARVLEECAAKRTIVELHRGGHECLNFDDNCHWVNYDLGEVCDTLLTLARIHADHPDFDRSWAC